jgi:hypothetical protein
MAAQVGGFVTVLYGYSVPVLLRRVKSEQNEEFWHVVGECYVHGIIDREAVRDKGDLSIIDQDEWFELR